VFLLGRRAADADAWGARPWVTFLFLPLVPLQYARFRGPAEATSGESWEVERSPAEAPRGDLWKTCAGAAGALGLALAPVGLAWWTIPQTGFLQALKVVIGASAPVLVLMWRDLRTPRVER
jgi:hypothetical protein